MKMNYTQAGQIELLIKHYIPNVVSAGWELTINAFQLGRTCRFAERKQ